jgi:hypothetical protein
MTDEKNPGLWSDSALAHLPLAGRAGEGAKSARGPSVEFGRAAIGPRRLHSIGTGKIVTAGLRRLNAG